MKYTKYLALFLTGMVLSLLALLGDYASAQGNYENPQIHIYKSTSKLALIDTSGRKLTFEAVTPKENNRSYLPNGQYELYREFPTCIIERVSNDCKSDKNGFYKPAPGQDNSFINLKAWGKPNFIVYTPMFFYPIGSDPDSQSSMSAIHSEITPCSLNKQRNNTCPPALNKIIPRFDTLGCVRLGSYDLKRVYTFIQNCFKANARLQIFVHS